jgi:hypothetical protein
VVGISPFTPEQVEIIVRFSKVFEQAYTRFLDLKKAEAQTREAQIESALERVRSRTNAMHRSESLHDVISEIYMQLRHLNFRFDGADFLTDYKDGFTLWLATGQTSAPTKMRVPAFDHKIFRLLSEAAKKRKGFFSFILTREEKDDYFNHTFENSVAKNASDSDKKKLLNAEGMATSCVVLKNIILSVTNFDSIPYTEAENEIIKRFAYVFEQSYTRFLDLQKAEAQAREAQIEAALERVRSKAMAMHTSKDLFETINAFFKELKFLGLTPLRCGVAEINDATKTSNSTVTTALTQGETYETIAKLKLTGHPILEGIYDSWKNQ